MFLRHRPSDERVRNFIDGQRNCRPSYGDLSGFRVDHSRVQLGSGAAAFDRARLAITRWKMFDLGWVELCWPDAPIAYGTVIAVRVAHLGFWSLNACRIVEIIDKKGPVRKFGFAYGTLPEHAERGEETFTVEWNSQDDSVWYDVTAYSKPNPLARLGYPLTRSLQKRFARESLASMVRATEG